MTVENWPVKQKPIIVVNVTEALVLRTLLEDRGPRHTEPDDAALAADSLSY